MWFLVEIQVCALASEHTLALGYLIFSRILVRYFFIPSASLLLMISSRFFSSRRMFSTCEGVRGLKRISWSR